jgi:hypothetical protein
MLFTPIRFKAKVWKSHFNFSKHILKKYEYMYTSSMYDTRFVELSDIKNKNVGIKRLST